MLRGSQRNSPGCVVWELTLACNFNCIHCGSSACKARDDELTIEEALSLCDDLKGIGTLGIVLMGGEPLMRHDWHIIGQRVLTSRCPLNKKH